MNAKKVLNQAFVLRCEIKVKQEQISTMQDNLTDIPPRLAKKRYQELLSHPTWNVTLPS